MEIVSGLTSAPAARLLQTWEVLDKESTKRFEDIKVRLIFHHILTLLQELVSFNNNFRSLREVLQGIPEECIPYLGVYLQDLTFIEDGNTDLTPSGTLICLGGLILVGMVNFEKQEMLSQHIIELSTFAIHRYKLNAVPAILEYLMHLPVMDQDSLYEESLLREGREENSKLREKWEKKGLLFKYVLVS